MPQVSVIIPVYNNETYLRECLDSVVNQTLKDIEIICVDDGSTDGSLSILEEYAAKDSRVKILTQKNQHAGVARNNGLKIANGEFVHFLDSDDWISLDAYEKLYEIIKNKEADFVKFKAYSYNNETHEITTRAYLEIGRIEEKYFDNCLYLPEDAENIVKLPDSPWSGIYSTKFLRDNNIYFDDFICANDVGFFYRCIINAKKIYLSSNRFVYYRENLKNSLIAKRAEHFDCQTALYEVVKEASKKLPNNIRTVFINTIINSAFNWYKKCLNEYKLSAKTKRKMKNEMQIFLKKISTEELDDSNLKNCKDITKQGRKVFLQSILSIKNIGIHKVFCILGFKFKIKSKKLIERERYSFPENPLDKLSEKEKIIKKQNTFTEEHNNAQS